MADRQARRGLTAPWANGKNAQGVPRHDGPQADRRASSASGVEEPYRWKDSVQSEAEIRLWVADGVANGLRPWFTKFAGVLHDPRWLKPVEELYRWYARLARSICATSGRSPAWGWSIRSRPRGSTAATVRERVEDHALGWYQALIEARIPFEMVHDRLLDAAHLAPFKTLILPNIAALSDAQCEQLRAFVERGGGLVATYETSLYDEWGVQRKDFGLADLFGVDFAGRVEGPMQNAYLRLEHDTAPGPSAAARARRRAAHHPRRLAARRRSRADSSRTRR